VNELFDLSGKLIYIDSGNVMLNSDTGTFVSNKCLYWKDLLQQGCTTPEEQISKQ
jgi:hypothetical protein